MTVNRVLFSLIMVLLFSGNLDAQKSKKSSSFFFIQLTDPQFGFLDENKTFHQETALYEKAVKEVNRLNPAFVVITGDFVNKGSDSAQWAEFDRITAKIKPSIPVYLTPGNHDIGQIPTQKQLDAYRNTYGSDKFSFVLKKNAFIGFNTSLIKADTPDWEQEQYAWLLKELKKAKSKSNVVLFCHFPFFTKDPAEPEAYSNIGPEKRMKYLELFSKNGVDAIFAGHYHNNALGDYKGIKMVTTSAVGKQLGKAPSGLRVVVVGKRGVASTYYGLENVPDVIDLNMTGHNLP